MNSAEFINRKIANFGNYKVSLFKRILCRVRKGCGLVVVEVFDRNTDVLEHFVKSLAEVTECNSAVMREVLLDKYMTIESAHLGDSEYADSTE